MKKSDERNNEMTAIRSEYMRITQRLNSEISRRQASGLTYIQTLTGLSQDILNGNFNEICSPPPPGSCLRLSMTAMYQAFKDLNASRIRAEIAGAAPTSHSSRASIFNLGNAVRNLEPEFLASRLPNEAIVTAESLASPKILSSNSAQNLKRPSCSRSRNIDQWERIKSIRIRGKERKRTAASRENASERKRIPSQKEIDNDPQGTYPLRNNANAPQRLALPRKAVNVPKGAKHKAHFSLDPNIPPYQYNPDTFNPSNLTLDQALTVMCSFNTDNDREYELIKTSLLAFSIKIYGLENCAKENLVPRVLLFIDRYFDIQPEIELCVRLARDDRARNVIGVLFDRCVVVNHILTSSNILTNTRYWVTKNDMCDWVIWNYEHK